METVARNIGGMILFLVVFLAATALLSAPSWYFAEKRDAWFMWDYATVVAPFAIWVLLTFLGIGYQSLSHILEPIALAILVPVLLGLRVFIVDSWEGTPSTNAMGVFVISCSVAIALRFFTPHMPE